MAARAGGWATTVVAVGLCLPFAFGAILRVKERNDRFCVACHLHEEKFVRFQPRPVATDLAGAHHASRQTVRCIECHGGADPVRRLLVWNVAAVDTLRFLVGRYQEPRRMRLPLRDAECRQCHDPIVRVSLEEEEYGRGSSYHAVNEHRTVARACVACHTAHTLGQKRLQFIDRGTVLPICRSCHEWIGEEVAG